MLGPFGTISWNGARRDDHSQGDRDGEVREAEDVPEDRRFPPLSRAGRAQRAHRNMLESLLIFAALVLVAQFAGKSNVVTALGAQLFFWGRLAYAPVYVIGIPWLRTGLWGVSCVGLLQILLQLL